MRPGGAGPRAVAALCAALALGVLLAFAPVLGNDFLAYDDTAILVDNERVRAGLTLGGVAWAFTSFVLCNWMPVTVLGHMLNVQLFGLAPGLHHLMSVLWHALAAVLLFLALRRLTGDLWRSALAAGVFAFHPLRVESVAWAAELKDPLSGCFFALTLLAYARYAARPTPGRYAAVAGALALGLMSKPTLVPLPALLLLLDWWPLGRWRRAAAHPRRLLLEKAPLLLLAAAAGAVTVAGQQGAMASLAAVPLPERLVNALLAAATYLGRLLWPAQLAVLYPHPEGAVETGTALAAGLVVLAASALALRLASRRPALALGWLWYLGMLLPVSGIVQVGLQGTADRYTYLPQIGVVLGLLWGAGRSVPPRAAVAGAFCLLAPLAAATALQVRVWRDTASLWEHAAGVTEGNWVALANLADARAAAGRHEEAVALLRRSVAVKPDHGPAHYALGYSLALQGRLPEALESLRRAVHIEPERPEFHLRLGTALVHAGRLPEGVEEFRAALRLRPGYAEARQNLERALALQGQSRAEGRRGP